MYSKYVENLIKNTGVIPSGDVDKLRTKSVTYAEIKDRISDFSSSNTVKLITEYSESGVDQVTEDKAQIRKTVAEKTIETAKKGKMKGLKDAFNTINAKTNKTYNENKYPELYPTVTTGPNAFDITALRTVLDNDEKALRDKFAEAHLETLKSALESIEKRGSLDQIEKNELEEIKRYLAGTPVPTEKRILSSELKSALRIVEFELKVDSNLKITIIKEKENYKDGELVLDKSKYPKDEEGKFIAEAINLFYYEKLERQNHAKKKYKKPFKDQQQEVF
ncbi:5285_t:CDS:2 [Funneliformis caledonium]|uniref:5285_t:CDS:1 n=1 Tax=Funneliformis caledonium TaxID=1117310 RepID=A0A9N9EXR2_9GLOM|nr:5285_t:CDS:2 [Funneliformis caledonium]